VREQDIRPIDVDDQDAAIAAAYHHVAAGYRRALAVSGLPPREVAALRSTLRAALELAREPHLSRVR
jgi:DNA-binding LacI/PurR family transcriptional regulator